MVHRAYALSSNWFSFDHEIKTLTEYFTKNSYPLQIIHKQIFSYLDNVFKPKVSIPTVPKKEIYLSMPYVGFQQTKFNMELKKIFGRFLPSYDLRVSPTNPLSISSLFKFKDTMPIELRSGVVYSYICPRCNLGSSYIGCTERLLRVRVDGHKGVSSRTGVPLKTKEHSSIRHHSLVCKTPIEISDFTILAACRDRQSLTITESIFIKLKSPSLNSDSSSVPLHLI